MVSGKFAQKSTDGGKFEMKTTPIAVAFAMPHQFGDRLTSARHMEIGLYGAC